MTTINFTKRIKDVISRQLTFDFTRLMTNIKEQFDSNEMNENNESINSYNKDIEIRISPYIETHNYDCENFPFELDEDEDCNCSNVRNITFKINIRYKDNFVFCFPVKEISLEDMLNKIKYDFPNYILICQCGSKAEEDHQSKCRQCFIHSYIRTEEEGGDCPICFENDGVWMKTKCGHIFHQHCFKKVKETNSMCPICREDIEHNICYEVINPYNSI